MKNNVFKIDTDVTQSGSHVLQAGQNANFSFGPEDIKGITMNADGSLVIAFNEGGELTIKNFEALANSGTTLTLADGTVVDPSLSHVAKAPVVHADNDNHMLLDIPSEGLVREITLEPAQQYIFNFAMEDVVEAKANIDGSYALTFKNGGVLILSNYDEAMGWDDHPVVSADPFITTASNDALLTNIEKLVFAKAEEIEEDAKAQSKLAKADVDAADVANIEPAAGDDQSDQPTTEDLDNLAALADALAEVEPAAGESSAASSNSGYGFNSSAASVSLEGKNAIGALGRTALNYNTGGAADDQGASMKNIGTMAIDDIPEINVGSLEAGADESSFAGGQISANGQIIVNFGSDGPGAILPNAQITTTGSVAGGTLHSEGVPVMYTQVAGGYEGHANGQLVFTFQIDPNTGEYTYTQFKPIDHADGTDADDEIVINFGFGARDNDGDTVFGVVKITIADDAPIAHLAIGDLDEAGISPGIVTGSLVYNYGADADGSMTTSGAFSATGSVLSSGLTSGGVAVTVTPTATGYIGMAGTTPVFTLHVNLDTGAYTYTQLAPLDHADNTDTSDVIQLNFGMTLTDGDGDSVDVDIRIDVTDDAPVAVDEDGVAIESQTVMGNLLSNDDLSVDGNEVSQVAFNGQFYSIPSGSSINVIGTYGVLTVHSNGDYSYKANSNNPDGTDSFTYTLVDGDGDSSTANLSISVSPIDDVPSVISTGDLSQTVDETDLGVVEVSGLVQADFGTDGPGTYALNTSFVADGSLLGDALTSKGHPVNVTLVGNTYTGIANGVVVFTMQMNGVGEYTFTLRQPLDHADGNNDNDDITLNFGFTASDNDDDTVNGTVTIHVLDDAPVVGDDAVTLDVDTNVASGNLLTNDDVGADGGRLTSITINGVDHAVPATGSIVINGAHGTLLIDADGNYTYTLTDLNAPYAEETFTYTLTDGDGDKATSTSGLTVTIESRDNTPVLVKPSTGTVDEDDIGSAVINGQLTGEFFDDGFAGFGGTGTFNASGSILGGNLTSNGLPINVAYNDATGTYTGTAGSTTVFTLVINHDGSYTFTLLGNLDHANPNDPNDIIRLEFGVDGTDLDGDAGTSVIAIDVKDSVPVLAGSTGDVDESGLETGPISYIDTIDSHLVDGATGIVPGGDFTASANGAPLALTSGGVAVIVTQTANGYVGTANGQPVFTLTIAANGQYTYTQTAPLDHPNTADHGDTLSLNFAIDISTVEGDTVPTTITINVGDDGIEARNDIAGAEEDQLITGDVLGNDYVGEDTPNTVTNVLFNGANHTVPAGGSVTIHGQFGTLIMNSDGTYSYQATAEDPDGTEVFTYTARDGDGDTDTATLSIRVTPDGEPVAVNANFDVDETNIIAGETTYNGALNIDFGGNAPGSVGANNSFAASGSMTGGTLSSHGLPISVALVGGVYVGTAGGNTVFTLTIHNNGTYTFKLLDTLDHANATDPNDVIKLEFGVTIADTDGDSVDGLVTIHVHDDAVVARADINGAEEDQFITGNVTSNDYLGEDTPNTVTNVLFNGVNHAVPAGGSVTIHGQFGTLIMNNDGTYSYQATAEDPNGVEHFVYTLRDGDGDTDTATLDITVTPDGEPVAVSSFFDVDETNLIAGETTYNGQLSVDFGDDGIGSITGNNNFVASGSMTGGALTSHGVPVSVSYNAATSTYTGTAGGAAVFTLTIHADGKYTFTLLNTLDHANVTDPNDVINLTFGVVATDADGDAVQTEIVINVHDDAPTARADINGAEEGQFISGDVTANDVIGKDAPNAVTNVLFNGVNHAVPAGGAVTINGAFGTLVMNSNGTYSYQASNDDPDGLDVFTYTLRDSDGDTNVATLSIRVTPDGEPVAVNATFDVDETNMVGGELTFDGNANVDFGQDGAGSVLGNNQFAASGSMGAQLTSNGLPVSVQLVGGVYIGSAGGQPVFTLSINNDGTYQFKMVDTLDHANGSDPNDVIKLTFGIRVTDADGDAANGQIVINVHDDAPVAVDDVFTAVSPTFEPPAPPPPPPPAPPPPPPPPAPDDAPVAKNDAYTFRETDMMKKAGYDYSNMLLHPGVGTGITIPTTEAGVKMNVLSNDKMSADGGNKIVSAVFVNAQGQPIATWNGTSTSIAIGKATYTVKINADGQSLQISADKADGNSQDQTMYIKYTIRDADGDESSAIATVNQDDNTSPLVLDLDGDGIELINASAGTQFDMGSDGVKDTTSWVGKDDGLLVIDKDNNGTIDNQSELFGTSETDGFSVLSQYDSNGDGKITNADALWNKLQVWQDANGDGISQAGELKSLNQLGITSINLNAAETGTWNGDSFISHESTFTYADGREGKIVDAWFNTNDRVDVEGTTYPMPVNPPEGAVIGNVLANDKVSMDVATKITVVSIGGQNYAVSATGATVVNGAHGKLTIWANGAFQYEPAGTNEQSVVETFRYTVRDGDGDTNSANLRINVEPQAQPDDAPVAVDDNLTYVAPTPSTPANTPPDAKNDSYNIQERANAGQYGTVDLDTSAGTPSTVNPLQDWLNGLTNGISNGSTVNNSALNSEKPVVLSYTATSGDKQQVVVWKLPVLSNDTDANGDALKITSISGITGQDKYQVQIAPDGLSVYVITHRDGDGSDSTIKFNYTVTDGKGGTDTASVVVKVDDNNSPLVLDLDGDGIELLNVTAGVKFDLDSNNTLDNTSWVGKDDGLLAIDKNNNGKIDNQSELFGSNSKDGFSMLRDYDSNGDGKITSADALWNKLMVWKDANSDGITDAGELKSLTQMGISSINLNAAETGTWNGDSFISHESTFTWTNGQTGKVVDAWFNVDNGDAGVNVQGQTFDMLDNAPAGAMIGNVMANDNMSNDGGNRVTQVKFEGQSYNVPATGTVTVEGKYGTLQINAQGAFSYLKHDVIGGEAKHFNETKGFPTLSEGYSYSGSQLGLANDALKVSSASVATVKFVSEGGDNSNMFGAYTVAADGSIHGVDMLIRNTNNTGVASYNINVPAGHELKFFIVQDGFDVNPTVNPDAGTLNFVYDFGKSTERLATVNDAPGKVTLVYNFNTTGEKAMVGNTFHTTDRNETAGLNADGKVHTISGLANGSDTTLRIGFEDLTNLGDKDYQDLIIDVSIKGGNPTSDLKETFQYTIADADGDQSTANLNITIPASAIRNDDAPVAVADAYTFTETSMINAAQTMNVLANDKMSADGGNRIISAVFVTAAGVEIGTSVLVYNGQVTAPGTATDYWGRLVGNIGGQGATYTVAIAANGQSLTIKANGADLSAQSEIMYIKYTVQDADGDTSSAIARVTQNDNTSPLVLDLDGNGVDLLNVGAGVQFDIDNDGIADNIGWVGGADALLALDKNGDGLINNQSELFGNNDVHADGFANLASYDVNQDGKIDANDEVFAQLKVWKDVNADGISGEGELLTLEQVGIVSLNLTTEAPDNLYVEGNWISHIGSFTMADGSVRMMADVWFGHGQADDLYGSEGADTFLFQTIGESAQTLHGFNALEGDALDLSALLDSHDNVSDAINEFVHSREENGFTIISVDVDGASGAAAAVDIVKIDSLGLDVQQLVDNGNIIL